MKYEVKNVSGIDVGMATDRQRSLAWNPIDCQGITFRTIGSVGKRNRRTIQHSRDGSCNLPVARPCQIETKYYNGSRTECNMRKDFYYTRNNRILIGSNVDSGLGESTPQEFSSCCSSSADSAKPTRVVRIFFSLASKIERYPSVYPRLVSSATHHFPRRTQHSSIIV